MTRQDVTRWEAALQEMLKRWRLILEKIDGRDRGAVLVLANLLDEFCELAAAERKALVSNRDDPAIPVLKFSPDQDVTGRCAFCRAAQGLEVCFDSLHALNRAVLDGQWSAARRVAEERLARLQGLEFVRRPDQTSH
jgi:hypothetical protein